MGVVKSMSLDLRQLNLEMGRGLEKILAIWSPEAMCLTVMTFETTFSNEMVIHLYMLCSGMKTGFEARHKADKLSHQYSTWKHKEIPIIKIYADHFNVYLHSQRPCYCLCTIMLRWVKQRHEANELTWNTSTLLPFPRNFLLNMFKSPINYIVLENSIRDLDK